MALPSLGELLQIFLKVCDGVAFAHSRGVVHRDLKPDNIMVGDFGEVLVMDWGLAKIVGREDIRAADLVTSSRLESTPTLTADGSALGTPVYMSPEQADGELDKIDHRSDIYSLGAILYEILTLERPVEGETPLAVLVNVVGGKIVRPEERAPGRNVPRELSAIALKCLSKLRSRRYQSVGELKGDVSLFLEGRSVSAAPDTFAQALVKLVKRNKGVSAAVAAAVAIIVVLTAVFVVRLQRALDRALKGETAAKQNEEKAVSAERDRRGTALEASEALAREAMRAADEARFAVAEERADLAVEVMPDGPWGHYARGVIAFEKNQFASARKHFEKALSHNPGHHPSKLFLARVLARAGELENWEKLLADADRTKDWRSLVAAGDALFDAERYSPADKAFRRALALMKGQAAIPATVRADVKQKLARVLARSTFRAFHASIRHLPVQQQASRIQSKLREIYGEGVHLGVRVGQSAFLRIDLHAGGDMVRWLDPLAGLPVGELDIAGTAVTDLTPLKGTPLEFLNCDRTHVSDLAPLQGMALTRLQCSLTQVEDLAPLRGMPLTQLYCGATPVSDLAPLEGMRLTHLNCGQTQVSDLTPLQGMPLTFLHCYRTLVTDLSPLRGMPLTELWLCECPQLGDLSALKGMPLTGLSVYSTGVRDLGPLKGMPLRMLWSDSTRVTDLTPLAGMALQKLTFTPKLIKKGIEVVRGMKSIRQIGTHYNRLMAPEEFWKKYDAGEFK